MSTSTRILTSNETVVERHPQRFAINEDLKIVTFIKNEPPANVNKGRKRNPVITAIYSQLVVRRNEWAHINIQITSSKQKASIISSLYSRAKKDNLLLSTRSMFNDKLKTYELWVKLSA